MRRLTARLEALEAHTIEGACPHLPPQIVVKRRGPEMTGYAGDTRPSPVPDTRVCRCGRARPQIVIVRDLAGQGEWTERRLPAPEARARKEG